MDKLKPCPFCGGEAHTFHNYLWHVKCDGTGGNYYCVMGFGAFVTEAEAIAAWNRRAETVEQRTCRNVYEKGHFKCSECGHYTQARMVYRDGEPADPRYCPNCGAKVVSE